MTYTHIQNNILADHLVERQLLNFSHLQSIFLVYYSKLTWVIDGLIDDILLRLRTGDALKAPASQTMYVDFRIIYTVIRECESF